MSKFKILHDSSLFPYYACEFFNSEKSDFTTYTILHPNTDQSLIMNKLPAAVRTQSECNHQANIFTCNQLHKHNMIVMVRRMSLVSAQATRHDKHQHHIESSSWIVLLVGDKLFPNIFWYSSKNAFHSSSLAAHFFINSLHVSVRSTHYFSRYLKQHLLASHLSFVLPCLGGDGLASVRT